MSRLLDYNFLGDLGGHILVVKTGGDHSNCIVNTIPIIVAVATLAYLGSCCIALRHDLVPTHPLLHELLPVIRHPRST